MLASTHDSMPDSVVCVSRPESHDSEPRASSASSQRQHILSLYGVPSVTASVSMPSVAASASVPDASPAKQPSFRQYLCPDGLPRRYPDGTTVAASMEAGLHGFAMARFQHETPVETDMPNIALPVMMKRPACSVTDHEARPRPHVGSYHLMAYKSKDSFGIRQRDGHKKQVRGVSKAGKRLDDLRSIAETALDKLESGESIADVKKWAKAQLTPEVD